MAQTAAADPERSRASDQAVETACEAGLRYVLDTTPGIRRQRSGKGLAYVDAEGQRRTIGSEDVNQYLKQVGGGEFTAKDFRTWNGTVDEKPPDPTAGVPYQNAPCTK